MLAIAYLLGQHPQDGSALTLDDRDEARVSIKPLKTGREVRIENERELARAPTRICAEYDDRACAP